VTALLDHVDHAQRIAAVHRELGRLAQPGPGGGELAALAGRHHHQAQHIRLLAQVARCPGRRQALLAQLRHAVQFPVVH
jgi:hypothetical protein